MKQESKSNAELSAKKTIRTKKKEVTYGISDEGKPSEEMQRYWLEAYRQVGTYPEHTARGGKWLIFIPTEIIDEVWVKIKQAVEEGKLGDSAKVSTAKPNPNSADPSKHVICVYTYDGYDETDVRHIRQSLRELGIINKIPYKTDDATLKGQYQKAGHKRISMYYE